MRTKYVLVGVVVGVLFSVTAIVLAGNLDPSAGPTGAASQMYTLEQIYTRLSGGGNATKMMAFTEPAAGPGSTMHTLDDIYNLAWPARVSKTGQTERYEDGDDGDLEKGVAWPNPRFTDNGNGTVTDNLTGLIWLKNANCFGLDTWATALNDANWLVSGDEECDLSDSSVEGDWRLPNVRELQSLIDYGHFNPALPSAPPFSDVRSDSYWSSTTDVINPTTHAWVVYLGHGNPYNDAKAITHYVWPVRGGQ